MIGINPTAGKNSAEFNWTVSSKLQNEFSSITHCKDSLCSTWRLSDINLMLSSCFCTPSLWCGRGMIQGRRIARNIELKVRNLQYCSLLLLRNSFFGFYSNASDSGAQIIQLIGALLVEPLGTKISRRNSVNWWGAGSDAIVSVAYVFDDEIIRGCCESEDTW